MPNAFLVPEVSLFEGEDIEQRQRKPNSRMLTAFTIEQAVLKALQNVVLVSAGVEPSSGTTYGCCHAQYGTTSKSVDLN